MNRRMWTGLLLLVGCAAALVMIAAAPQGQDAEKVQIASLVNDLNRMGTSGLNELRPVPIQAFQLPEPGVDVMRAKLHETYSVDGVGTDTVELTGWIAVRHSKPYLADGETSLRWGTAVVDTEFVGMDLHGTSKTFGPVAVALDTTRPVYGQVGKIQIPTPAKVALMAKLEKNDAAPKAAKAPASKDKADKSKTTAKPIESAPVVMCEAQVNVAVMMPDLKLKMNTEKQVYWYSLVDTIPPVGHTASITIEPVRLIANGRAVATLESGVVDFREVVRHVNLSSDGYVMAFHKNKR